MKKINSKSTADISYVKEKWLAFTSNMPHKNTEYCAEMLLYIMASLLSTGTAIQKFISVGFSHSEMINKQVFYKLSPEQHYLPVRQF